MRQVVSQGDKWSKLVKILYARPSYDCDELITLEQLVQSIVRITSQIRTPVQVVRRKSERKGTIK